jgi:hypothetical protein
MQITSYVSSLTLHTAIVSTVRPLFGSRRNSQKTLYLFQKCLVCCDDEYIVSRNKIDPVSVTFLCFFIINFCRKLLTLHFALLLEKNCTVVPVLRLFLKRTERICARPDRSLGLRVRISPEARMSVSCECCVLGRGLCDGPITLPEDFYRLLYVILCDPETSRMRRPWTALGCCSKEKVYYLTTMSIVKCYIAWRRWMKCEYRGMVEWFW